jgi:hypothetical protein
VEDLDYLEEEEDLMAAVVALAASAALTVDAALMVDVAAEGSARLAV